MTHDRYGHEHSAQSREAIAAFEQATRAVAAHRPIGDCLTRALDAEPEMVSALSLRSLGASLLARSETMTVAAADAKAARAALTRIGGGTEAERVLVEAAEAASTGRLQAGALTLETYLAGGANDFLAAKAAHALRFMSGQPQRMLAISSLMLARGTEADPGYGFLLGCHSFGLEELGRYQEAEAVGRRAVMLEPEDAWGLHSVSHVMEMTGRADEGIGWLEASRPLWPGCNNFRYHLAWHLALFYLEKGDRAAVLELYDRDIMPTASDDFRDMANAVSLLWRLRQMDIDVGSRWDMLREIALKRHTDLTYVFASLHYLLALVANGERDAAMRLIEGLEARGALAQDDQCIVAREVGKAMAEAIASSTVDTTKFNQIANLLVRIGGSNAQRDVFMRTLLATASSGNDAAALSQLTRQRALLRNEDRFAMRIAASRTVAEMRGAA